MRILICGLALSISSHLYAQIMEDLIVVQEDRNSIVLEYSPSVSSTISRTPAGVEETVFRYRGAIPMQGPPGTIAIMYRAALLAFPSQRTTLHIVSADFHMIDGVEAERIRPPAEEYNRDVQSILGTYPAREPVMGILGSPPARLMAVEESRGLTVGTLQLFPIQYDRDGKSARVYSRIRIQIEHEPWIDARMRTSMFLEGKELGDSIRERSPLLGKQLGDSPLSQGEWYRMEVKETGIYKLDRDFFSRANISLSAIGNINSIRIFGRSGESLSEDLSSERPSAPVEVARLMVDQNGNGTFDADDYVLFYGQSPRWWRYVPNSKNYSHSLNIYTESNVYFLTFGGSGRGRDMDTLRSLSVSSVFAPSDIQGKLFVEEEKYNEDLKSGRDWWGPTFDINNNSTTYTNLLSGLVSTKPTVYRFRFVTRSTSIDTFQVTENDQNLASVSTFPVNVSSTNYFDDYYYQAPVATFSRTGVIPNDRSVLKINFRTRNQGAKGFLDWFEILFRQRPEAVSDLLLFDSPDTTAVVEYALSKFSSRDVFVFDVSNHRSVKRMTDLALNPADASAFKFQVSQGAQQVRSFAAVGPNGYKTPGNVRKLPNSNLQGIVNGAEYVIISPTDFVKEAERLKAHREKQEGLTTLVVNYDQLLNEFSNGLPDPMAIRNFLKYAESNWTTRPRYVLLFGDGHYDYKNISSTEKNWIPPYESINSRTQIDTYASDDHFVFLTPGSPRISMAIGRLMVRSQSEAAGMVDKIIGYETASALDPWRNRVTLVADDGLTSTDDEGSLHTGQSEVVAQSFTPPRVERKKIYIVEYPTVSGATGRRKPEANKAIIDAMNRGSAVVNYIGHGNPQQWAHEFIFTKDESIPQLKNRDRLFFLVAATCDFARYDNPKEQSAGEELLVMREGGAIGTLTSSRVVFSFLNAALNNTFYNFLFQTDSLGRLPRLGDVMWLTKQIHFEDNDRKFHLLADPAMRLIVPRPLARVDSVNGKSASQVLRIPTLGRVTVKGEIRRTNGTRWDDFNGRALLEIFDSKRKVPVFEWGNFTFDVNGSLLYRGEVTLSKGVFQATFPVPKDVSYDTSRARISLYAWSSTVDAVGYTENITIAGTDTAAAPDSVGPKISAYVGDPSFRQGDIVPPNSTLFIDLSDENGINTSAAGIGHRLQITFKENSRVIDLSDFYRSNLDTYTSGQVQYQLSDIGEGRHEAVIRAWDTHNNMSQADLAFDVRSATSFTLFNVVNVPNPFSRSTVFTFQRSSTDPIDVEIKIYTVAGRMIQTLESPSVTSRFVQVPWDGRDRDGSELANGVYFYKVIVKSLDRTNANEVLGKLSVLR